MSSVAQPSERRGEIRYSFYGELPARLFDETDNHELGFVLVDISRRGLGLLVSPSPKVGTIVRLEFDEANRPPLRFRVCYLAQAIYGNIAGLEEMKRCGCVTLADTPAEFDLIEYLGQFTTVMIGD